jgi:hypothetical protein
MVNSDLQHGLHNLDIIFRVSTGITYVFDSKINYFQGMNIVDLYIQLFKHVCNRIKWLILQYYIGHVCYQPRN